MAVLSWKSDLLGCEGVWLIPLTSAPIKLLVLFFDVLILCFGRVMRIRLQLQLQVDSKPADCS